ncbi:MAG: hypothetical protein KZQ81_04200, partial [Candidatus Thiodiazotropha sp. (ex Rostrolucina anterorostrata)]|nr:hypothetical protein [Candidatus Thiodiazotropha sp. (ex Rostrolucina anterorostrata)]
FGCFDVSQQQINQIRRFYSISQTPDSVITLCPRLLGITVYAVYSQSIPKPDRWRSQLHCEDTNMYPVVRLVRVISKSVIGFLIIEKMLAII